MATSTVEKAKGQVGSEKQRKVVMGKEPEQQIEDEQWEFIRDDDRYQNTTNDRLGIFGSYAVGKWVCNIL